MKGLLIKDCQLTMLNKQMMIAMVIVVPSLMIFGGEAMMSFAVCYLCIMGCMMVVGTITYDDMDHSMSFLMTLPVSRKLYVAEKYVFGGITLTISICAAAIIMFVYRFFAGEQIWRLEEMIGIGSGLYVILLLMACMVPMQLKFGADKGRMVIMGFAAVIMLVIFGAERVTEALHMDPDKMIENVILAVSEIPAVIDCFQFLLSFCMVLYKNM